MESAAFTVFEGVPPRDPVRLFTVYAPEVDRTAAALAGSQAQ